MYIWPSVCSCNKICWSVKRNALSALLSRRDGSTRSFIFHPFYFKSKIWDTWLHSKLAQFPLLVLVSPFVVSFYPSWFILCYIMAHTWTHEVIKLLFPWGRVSFDCILAISYRTSTYFQNVLSSYIILFIYFILLLLLDIVEINVWI